MWALTAVHTVAHLLNLEWLNNSKLGVYGKLSTALSNLEDEGNETFLNPLQHIEAVSPPAESKEEPFKGRASMCPLYSQDPQQKPIKFAFTSIAGLTGVVITLSLILIITSSMEVIRRSYFEVFWYIHHLFIVFFVGLVFHGYGYETSLHFLLSAGSIVAVFKQVLLVGYLQAHCEESIQYRRSQRHFL